MNTQTKSEVKITAVLTCPECNTAQKVKMPEEGLQHYYKCTNEACLADLAPLEGDDCIFCSYADTPCPQKQLNPNPEPSKLRSLL